MADDTNSSHRTCAHCGNEASLKCGRCETPYCNATCQKAHWKEHKKSCRFTVDGLDQYINRAGALLQDIFFIWAEKIFSRRIIQIERTETGLVLLQSGRGVFLKFPEHLVANEQEKKTVLSTGMCTQAVAHFCDIIDEMIEGTSCNYFEVNFRMRDSCQNARFGDQLPSDSHTVFVITDTSTSPQRQWVVDPTGLQFGNSAAVVSWDKYINELVARIDNANLPKGIWKEISQSNKTKSGMMGAIARVEWGATKVVRSACNEWMKNSRISFQKILQASEPVYQERRVAFLTAVEEQLTSFAAVTIGSKDFQRELALVRSMEVRLDDLEQWMA